MVGKKWNVLAEKMGGEGLKMAQLSDDDTPIFSENRLFSWNLETNMKPIPNNAILISQPEQHRAHSRAPLWENLS